jgi:hypothetical protein
VKIYTDQEGMIFEKLASDPATAVEGYCYWNTTFDTLRIYRQESGWLTVGTVGDTAGSVPIGGIVAYNPGYYTDASNGSFTLVGPVTNDVAGVNAYIQNSWRVCDGSEFIDATSPIWNVAGRYLPNLTDSRFIRGNTSSGTVGGAASVTPTGAVSSSFAGSAYAFSNWFKNSNYAPSGSVSISSSFNTSSLGSATYQAAHGHTWSGYAQLHHSSSYLRFREVSSGGWSKNAIISIGGAAGSGTEGTGIGASGTVAATRAGFYSATYGVSSSGSFSGTSINIRTTFANAGSYTPSGSVASSFTGDSISTEPKYLTSFYLVRVK